ncbi:MAG: hypothetical protein ABIK18_05175 [candidate division WOR-3 bacterium]
MRVAFPYMGDIYIVLTPMLETLGAEVIVPPEPNAETLTLGAQLAPETICLPFKLTLGNMVEALKLGADTLIYVTGSWSCRFGYYGRLQAKILYDLGYKFQFIELRRDRIFDIIKRVILLNNGNFSRAIVKTLKAFRLGYLKAKTLENAYLLANRTLPYALKPKECQKLFKEVLKEVHQTNTPRELNKLLCSLPGRFEKIDCGRTNPKVGQTSEVLRVKLVGESFCVIEPFVNFEITQRLGEMGVIVDPFLTAPRWVGFHGFRLNKKEVIKAQKAARKYWRYCVGGEDANSLGHLILAARAGYDGVIHLHPFACMPGTVVQPVLIKASQEYDIPLLSLSLDEHTSEAGFLTRLEAFVALLKRRRRSHKNSLNPFAKVTL